MTAKTTLRRIAGFAVGAAIVMTLPLTAAAGQAQSEVATPRVAVPHVPAPGGGADMAGCWSSQRLIYGPYAFSFCSNGRYGSYRVRGGGLACEGNVTVSPGRGGTATVRLSRSRCNGRTDWSADYLVCRSVGGGGVGYGNGGYGQYGTRGYRPEVAVPRAPTPRYPRVPIPAGRLDCTYYPTVAGYHPIDLAMVRN
ncbi:hypothetical protein [Microbaculum marinisediminis]|uniref:Uncharacterized protein n=1 Tax=Microbaculum marinisediminis TaxID=2931392 RepID=A0AAW5QUT7_9HYPH|nr:hypothetical protein [Microbaculum sp. A6E488]MCT8970418.1 hypothetical protein [Microbaculum sp. A6E488]